MTTYDEVMAALEAAGTAQARKIYARHGITSPMFGVSYAALRAIQKPLKVNHALAVQLWGSGNHDARVLALMLADPKQADLALLRAWIDVVDNYTLSDAIGGLAARSAHARTVAETWAHEAGEWVSNAGWGVVSQLAMTDKGLPDAYFEPFLADIAQRIHQRPNRTRYAMNNALINIGCRSAVLHERVRAVAEQVGEVVVDHGETSCETPVALPYIDKVLARKGYVRA
jgi:3-methyladenine DNA glycosylase AlkD